MDYFDELTFWFFVASAITLFVIGFRPLFKLVVSKIPVNGLREAVAA